MFRLTWASTYQQCVAKMRTWVIVPLFRGPVLCVLALLLLNTSAIAGVSEILLTAISLRENHKQDVMAVGDRHLIDKAYGIHQVRQPYLDDVMRITDSRYLRSRWGKDRLTLQDMRDPNLSRWVVRRYLEYYGWVYEQKTGKAATDEIYARIHNGGPVGWSRRATRSYWYAVRDIIHDLRREEWSKYHPEGR